MRKGVRMKRVKETMLFAVLAMLSLSMAGWGTELTGPEILARVDEEGEFVSEGSLITILSFETTRGDVTASENVFASFGKRSGDESVEYLLLYFLEPEDLKGMILLSVTREDPEEGSRIWTYSPGIESLSPGAGLKELDAEARGQSFAGSTLSRDEISGNFQFSEDYDAVLVGEEVLAIDENDVSCYILELAAKGNTEVDYAGGKMWVAKDTFLILRGEYLNDESEVVRTLEVRALGEFEGDVVVDALENTSVIDKEATVIRFLERKRPSEPFPDAVFSPEALADFDPEVYGVTLQ
jgi:hypothetical protein